MPSLITEQNTKRCRVDSVEKQTLVAGSWSSGKAMPRMSCNSEAKS